MNIIKVFKTLSNSARQDILLAIKNNPMTLEELIKQLNLSNTEVIAHIDILKKDDFIFEIFEDDVPIYKANMPYLEEIHSAVNKFKK